MNINNKFELGQEVWTKYNVYHDHLGHGKIIKIQLQKEENNIKITYQVSSELHDWWFDEKDIYLEEEAKEIERQELENKIKKLEEEKAAI